MFRALSLISRVKYGGGTGVVRAQAQVRQFAAETTKVGGDSSGAAAAKVAATKSAATKTTATTATSSSTAAAAATTTPAKAATPTKAAESILLESTKKPPSRIRAVFFGFLAGISFSCGVGYIYLTDDINAASVQLQKNVRALTGQVQKVADSLSRVDHLETELAALRAEAARNADFKALREDMLAEKDALRVALAEHKASVWEAQEEMYKQAEQQQRS